MSTSGSFRHFIGRPRHAALFVVLAVAGLGFTFWQNSHSAPEERHIEAGAQLLAKGRGAEAEREWREAVRLAPRDAGTWELLGDYYLAVNNWRAALEAFGHVRDLRPDTANLHPRLALAAVRASDFETAQRHSTIALEQNPNDITGLKVAAAVAEKKAQSDQQLKYLRRLVDLQPKDPNLLMALAAALAAQYQYAQALPLLDRILEIDPQFMSAYALRGQVYYQDNPTPQRLDKAEADLKKALQVDPGNVECHRYLARVYMRLNQPARAIHHFQEVARDRPYASAHLYELSQAYRKAGDVRKAEESLRLFNSLGQLNDQMSAFASRISKNPNDFDTYLQMVRVLLKSAESSEATYQLYRYKYLKRELASVAAYLNKAAKLRPGDARLRTLEQQVEATYQKHLQQSSLFITGHNYDRADWHLGRAVLLRPDDERTRQALLHFMPDNQAKAAALAGSGLKSDAKNSAAATSNAVQSPWPPR